MENGSMKVLIKGAGDLASGIGIRLHRCGFTVLMTEIPVPTTVRRTVACSRAVYEEVAVVEDVTAVLCKNAEEINQVTEKDQIAVIVDRDCRIREIWKPDVVVDAILAKKNLGTSIKDAPIVVGVGPGFTAGTDCHVVVETKRGHDLGRCIWQGSAIANTGVPGMIGGYDKERLIKATGSGEFRGTVSIGDMVAGNDVVGYAGGKPIYAQISGVVRGILQDGVVVTEGMKSGDIDPRGNIDSCFTISDKANAIGGGVLEAVLGMVKSGKKPGIEKPKQ